VHSDRSSVVLLPSTEEAPPEVKKTFDEIQIFYAMERVPAVFRWMARDAIFLQGYWGAVREAFTGRKLDLTKEIFALAASMTAKSDYGVDLHLRETRRHGRTEQGLTEAVEVVQLFNTVTKIADALRLQPDFNPTNAARESD
jgi:alkylhydroperoxidase/carboxymuconolactone decarboxylase family protein YurZ